MPAALRRPRLGGMLRPRAAAHARVAAVCLAVAAAVGMAALPASARIDHAPIVSGLTLTPVHPTRTAVVTASASAHDREGDRTWLHFTWFRNGTRIAGASGRRLDLSGIAIGRGDLLTVRAVAGDGVRRGPATTASVTIRNAAPVVNGVAIDEVAPTADQTLHPTVNASDADGDQLTVRRTWTWTCADGSGSLDAGTLDLGALELGHGCLIGL